MTYGNLWVVKFWSKESQISPQRDKSGTSSDQISVHFGLARQNVPKSDQKGTGFGLFWANLTHFGAKADTPGLHPL